MRTSKDTECRATPRGHSRLSRILTTASLVLAFPGCGGGGGGNGSGVSLSVEPLALSVSATTTQRAPIAGFTVDFPGLGQNTTVYIATKIGGQGISSVINNGGTLPASIGIQFDLPAALGLGTYHGTVQVQGCMDKACTIPVAHSPQTIDVQYTVTASTFTATGLSPSSAYAGAQSFTVTVDGTSFTPRSQALWNGTILLSTTFVNASQLTAQVPASLIATLGPTVVSASDPVNGTTNSLPFTIKASPLTATSLSPATVYAGNRAFILTLTGSGFTANSTILWDGTPLVTTFVSATQLTAQVPASDIAATGTHAVSASDPIFGTSGPQTLTVAPARLFLDFLSPKTVTAGGTAFTLTVLGTVFTGTSVVEWNGIALTTTLISSTELIAQVPAGDIAATGTASVLVSDPHSAPGTTGALPLTIASPSKDAVAYQIDAAHDGAMTFASTTSPPWSQSWSVDVGGTPSYALTADGLVILTVQLSGNSELLALHQSDGTQAWAPISLPGTSFAAYDGGKVFVVSESPITAPLLQAYDVDTGALIWTKTLTGFISFTGLPVAADGTVYVICDGLVEAIDESTGTLLWSRGVGGLEMSPAVTADGVYTTYTCESDDLRPATGEQIWLFNVGCSGGGGGVPVVANQLDYATGNIFDAESGTSGGTYTTDSFSSPAFSATMGYFLQLGTLRGVTLSNDTVQWSFPGNGTETLRGSPVAVNQYVFIGSSAGNLYAVDSSTATGTATPVWTVNLGTTIDTNEILDVPFSGLAAGNGLLIVSAGTKVFAFTISTSP